MKEHHFTIERQARYFTAGNPESGRVLFVLHGYAQLAERFIGKFHNLEDDFFIVAPEGFHRFYVKGSSGHVGASWMTKEDRETDIADYISYLNKLQQHFPLQDFPDRTVLGFSQGVATAFRWISDGVVAPNHFIIASGVLPPDLDLKLKASAFQNVKMDYITGDDDPFKNEDEVVSALQSLAEHGFELGQTSFKGGHRVDPDAIRGVLQAVRQS